IGQNDEINFRWRSDRQWPRRAWRRYRVRPARRANLRPVRCLPSGAIEGDRRAARAGLRLHGLWLRAVLGAPRRRQRGARPGRPGPVSLEMPWDVFTQRAEVGPAKVFDSLPAPQPDPDRIKAAAALIKDSKRPMIFVGSGAIHAREEILELAEMIDAPVVAFRSGRGIVSNAHELGLTMAAAYRLWPNTDLMIGIGTRLELPTMSRWPYRPDGLKSVRIDIDPVEMRRFISDAA